jgi:hypothetical protein
LIHKAEEESMRYTKEKLQAIVRTVLSAAQVNLKNHGYLQPVGLIFTLVGMSKVFQFKFHDVGQKRASQVAFKKVVKKSEALAVVVVTESWLKMPPDVPVDITQSIADIPGRQEAIVIEAVSGEAKTILIQVFRKEESGIAFDDPVSVEEPFSWGSEWTDGIGDFLQGGTDA